MASGNELGLDTSALKRDLQALLGQQAAAAGGSVKKRKRAETETELTQKIRASWDHVEIVRQMNHKIMDAGVQEAGCEA
eukprot:CAMPEP_0180263012 /NCGR_PEP_ID=MMETSP0987-20121128/45040_1 /TAXON_ID=697907 /ORGANISM="non described non described, Strain CCMP2293" /LENGTH=78 /DNA_ID=CAMNT_0022233185 /DNA_START=32 /DNA_END=265 /DNA_ORIENTATION=-